MIIQARTPTRIDLAGGTIDIWPLYLMHREAVTINIAIDLYATVTLIPIPSKKIIIESIDQDKILKIPLLKKIPHFKALKLILEIIRFYSPSNGFRLITDCSAPAGSGIGGSSALNIAVNGALNFFTGNRYSRKEILTIAKNIEARVIGVPTGEQDYYSALYGGVNAIHLKDEGVIREKLQMAYKELERFLVLCFVGIPRDSGTNNWDIMKKHIDGNKGLYLKMESIKQTALKMKEAVSKNRFNSVAKLINEEWRNRKNLSQKVSSPKIEKIIKSAILKGAEAAKICGAGGGGCLVLFVPPEKRKSVEEVLALHKCDILPFRIAQKGLVVTVKKE